jgi:hypothetical protein
MWLLCSFQGPSRGVYAGRTLDACGRARRATAPPPADAGLSKLNSMPALFADFASQAIQVARRLAGAGPTGQVRSTC